MVKYTLGVENSLAPKKQSQNMVFPNDENTGLPPFQGGQDSQPPQSEDELFDGGTFYVDFGPFFGQELAKILRFKQSGLMTEIVFWQGGFGY